MKKLIVIFFTLVCSAAMASKPVMIKMETNMGTIVVKLYDETPLHKANFVKLTQAHYFDSLLFHRVINKFMIQGGDPESKRAIAGQMLGNGGPAERIPAEFNPALFHKKGVLAAARDNNPTKASSGSQFYIVQGKTFTDAELDMIESSRSVKYTPAQREIYKTIGGTPHLDMGYTVFGEVVSGLDVIDKIATVSVGQADRPVVDVRILSVSVIRKKFLGIF
jgi:cyclophilin family peptidyl-prolyl cis-trans isomerase